MLSRPTTRSDARLHDRALLLGIAVAALNLRLAVIGLPPLLQTIRQNLHMSSAFAGLLSTVPFVCTGAVSVFTVHLMQRRSQRQLVAVALVLIAAGLGLRSLSSTALGIVLLTVPIGVGIGVLTVTLPPVVKRWFSTKGGGATGAYLTASGLGAAAAAFLAVPLARALGSWRSSLAIGGIPALVALPYWLWATRDHPLRLERGDQLDPPMRRPQSTGVVVFLLAAAFACQSAGFSGTISWLATLYEHAGWSANHAGFATAFVTALSVPAAALIPHRSDGGDRRRWVAVMAALAGCGILGFALEPRTLAWLWLVCFGVGNGALFPLILALVLDHASDEHDAAVLTRWTWGISSLLAGFTPLLIGALRDAAISFSAAFALLAACTAASGALVMGLPHRSEITARLR